MSDTPSVPEQPVDQKEVFDLGLLRQLFIESGYDPHLTEQVMLRAGSLVLKDGKLEEPDHG